MPAIPDAPTTQIPQQPVPQSGHGGPGLYRPSAATAVAACAASIISGWAASVVATDLIVGWWNSELLFCIAVSFLALVFASATISGVIALLLRRPVGRWLIATGSVVALLTYLGVFLAGARVAWIVYTLWIFPLASAILALHPRTKRWLLG